MIEQLLDTFKKIYKEQGDNLILDSYILTKGIYILVNINTGKILTKFEVDKDNNCQDNKYYKHISYYDYNTEIADTNKALDSKKKILANQLFAVKVKLKNLNKEDEKEYKTMIESIDNYFEKFKNFRDSLLRNKFKIDIYDSLDDKIKNIGIDYVDKIKKWVSINLFSYFEPKDKNLKIFFVDSNLETAEEIERSYDYFKNGNKIYTAINLFVNSNSCISKNGKVFGVPNSWYTQNADKPSLKNSSKINELPILVDIIEAEFREKLRIYLLKEVKKGNRFVYFSETKIFIINKPLNDYSEYQFLIKITMNSDGEVIFQQMNPLINDDFFINIEEIVDFRKSDYEKDDFFLGTAKQEKVKDLVNSIVFNNRLEGYFLDLDVKRDTLKHFTLKYKNALYNWLVLGETREIKFLIKNIYLERFKMALFNKESAYKIRKILNLGFNLENYFNNNINYKECKMRLKNELVENLNKESEWEIKNDEELSFLIGQLLSYLNSKTKGKDKFTFEFLRAFSQIDTKDKEVITTKINRAFMGRCYEILTNKSRNCLASIINYFNENKFKELNQEVLLLGTLVKNQLFSKVEEETLNEEINQIEGVGADE